MSRYLVPKEYLFEQLTPASTWVINHACGFPVIDIFTTIDGKIEKMIAFEVLSISDTQSEVRFTRPFAGFAKIVG